MIRFIPTLIPAAAACLLVCTMAASADAETYTTRKVTTTTVTTTPATTTVYTATPVIVNEGIIDLGAATTSALGAEPGRVERSALSENSRGEPVYVFDIRSGDMSHIVRVNAFTGKVVGRDFANPRDDRLFASTRRE